MYNNIPYQLTEQEQHWYDLLQESKKNGMTQKKFCELSGIDYKNFRKQRFALYKKMGKFKHFRNRKGEKRSGLIRFLPVKFKKDCANAKQEKAFVIIEVGEVRVFVPTGFDPATLKNIIKVIS